MKQIVNKMKQMVDMLPDSVVLTCAIIALAALPFLMCLGVPMLAESLYHHFSNEKAKAEIKAKAETSSCHCHCHCHEKIVEDKAEEKPRSFVTEQQPDVE